MVTLAAAIGLGLGQHGAQAQAPAPAGPTAPHADCSTYRKLSDGRWTSTIEAKIGNPKSFIVLKPGMAIDRSLTIVGLNVSDTLDTLCGK